MDRLFLDANVLFSAAYQPEAGLLGLWKLKNVLLCSSGYAVAEADLNLDDEPAQTPGRACGEVAAVRGTRAGTAAENFFARKRHAASDGRHCIWATHLLTGNVRDFGAYFGKKIEGVMIVLPGECLRMRGRQG